MTSKPDGGFTCGDIDLMNVEAGATVNIGSGPPMTLRHWYAGKAPEPPDLFVKRYRQSQCGGEYSAVEYAAMLAQWSFLYADAMIKAGESE